jgi:hypothetical protein
VPNPCTAIPAARERPARGSLVEETGMRSGLLRSSPSGRSRMDGAGLQGAHRQAVKARTRRRALAAAAWPSARAWEGARGQDLVALSVVVAGVGVAGRPPAGSPGLPPHGPASWQGAWVSGWSSGLRRSAWRPDHTSGTPPTPWPFPSSSAARNSRSRRSDTRRWPHNLQDTTVGGVGTGSLFYARASPSSRVNAALRPVGRYRPPRCAGVIRGCGKRPAYVTASPNDEDEGGRCRIPDCAAPRRRLSHPGTPQSSVYTPVAA